MIILSQRTVIHSNGEKHNVFFPKIWSDLSCRIVSEKYFHRVSDTKRENNISDVAKRMLSGPINYLVSTKFPLDVDMEYSWDSNELIEYLINLIIFQRYSPNSPVWFNIGIDTKEQQAAACFIVGIEDNLVDSDDSIASWVSKEARIFKRGSGSGTNISRLRAENELLGTSKSIKNSGYGIASGPVSFMKVADVFAGVIKSGGEARRAAAMRICDIDHIDVEKFIECKVKYEKIGRKIVEAGIMPASELQDFLPFQNANHCVRLTRQFWSAIANDNDFKLKGILRNPDGSHRITKDVSSHNLLEKVVDAIWEIGEPTIHFSDNINEYNTCTHLGEIVASNPCSEYMWFENTSCNLGAVRLTAYYDTIGRNFDIELYKKDISAIYLYHHALISYSDYPTDKIKEETNKYCNMGLGYTDLGGLLMLMGVPYDSVEGRTIAFLLTALLTGQATIMSFAMAKECGPYDGLSLEHHYRVLRKQCDSVGKMHDTIVSTAVDDFNYDTNDIIQFLLDECFNMWCHIEDKMGQSLPLANAQLTLLAPTGTTRFSLGAVTTGIEPEYALSYKKHMVDGTTEVITNEYIDDALASCGVTSKTDRELMVKYIEEVGTIENFDFTGYDVLTADRVIDVLTTASSPQAGGKVISPEAHLLMMSAVQPMLSGGISKTVNLPESTTREEIENLIFMAHNAGIKSVSFFRDGCKSYQQPIEITKKEKKKIEQKNDTQEQSVSLTHRGKRRTPPGVANGKRVKLKIMDSSFGIDYPLWLQFAEYENGDLAEVWITGPKEGNLASGLFHTISILMSYMLQLGATSEYIVKKFKDMNFAPSGICKCDIEGLTFVSSPIDAIVRVIDNLYCSKNKELAKDIMKNLNEDINVEDKDFLNNILDVKAKPDANKLCLKCSYPMFPDGKCWSCTHCGENEGGCSE